MGELASEVALADSLYIYVCVCVCVRVCVCVAKYACNWPQSVLDGGPLHVCIVNMLDCHHFPRPPIPYTHQRNTHFYATYAIIFVILNKHC